MNPTRHPFATGAGLLVVVAAIALPFLAADAPFVISLASYALIAAIVAISLDLLMGNTPLISFGHAGWYGLGAYVGGLFAKQVSAEFVLVVLAAMAVAALLALGIGLILVRQVGKTFAILTLAFSQILFSLVFVAGHWTGGEDGLQGIPQPTVFGAVVSDPRTWYWTLLGIALALVVGALAVRRSALGQTWLAVKVNEQRARFIGIATFRMKLAAYVVSAAVAALAGALFALYSGSATPDTMSWYESGKILMYAILGGVGTIVGPAIGAVAFTVAEHNVSAVSESWLIYFGGLFVLVVIVAPGGLLGLFHQALARRRT